MDFFYYRLNSGPPFGVALNLICIFAQQHFNVALSLQGAYTQPLVTERTLQRKKTPGIAQTYSLLVWSVAGLLCC